MDHLLDACDLPPPEPLERLLDVLSGSAAPCALFALGVTVTALLTVLKSRWNGFIGTLVRKQ